MSAIDKDSPLLLLSNVKISKSGQETELPNLCYKTT